METIESLLNEDRLEEALNAIDDTIERVCAMINFGQWNVKGINGNDVVFALLNLEDDILDILDEEDNEDLDWDDCDDDLTDDEDFEDDIEECDCGDCEDHTCPCRDEVIECGGWAC